MHNVNQKKEYSKPFKYLIIITSMIVLNVWLLMVLDFILEDFRYIHILLDSRQKTGVVISWIIVNWFVLHKLKIELKLKEAKGFFR